MKKLLLIFALFSGCRAVAQESGMRMPVYEHLSLVKNNAPQPTCYHLFNGLDKPNQHQAFVAEATYLKLKEEALSAILGAKAELIEFVAPVGQEMLSLELYKVELLSPEFSLRTSSGNQQGALAEKLFYRGVIKDNPNSLAAVSFIGDEVRILVSDERGNYRVHRLRSGLYVAFPESSLLDDEGIGCGLDRLALPQMGASPTTANRSPQTGGCLEIFFECDYQLFLDNGSSIIQTEQLVYSIFNEVQTLYENVGIPILISDILVWNTPDPYIGTSDFIDYLYAFSDFRQNNYNGRIAHLLTSRTLDPLYSGLAFIDVLCDTYSTASNRGPYSFSSKITTAFAPFPNYSHNIHVVAHELGHNLGSQHTHACVWNGNNTQIDDCGNVFQLSIGLDPEGDMCFNSQNPILPSNGGTLMSYCQRLPSIGVNFYLGFGSQPGNLLLSNFNAASCATGQSCSTCNCPEIYDPVCGADGITYTNSCYADCAGVSWTQGPCTITCDCPQNYNPVCGSDGITYTNSCYAGCAGVSWTPGVCQQTCNCPDVYSPVCGSDGITYTNSCYAQCAGVSWTTGVCQPVCNCPQDYDPVCGSDGITYTNSCYAECAGVSWSFGPCQAQCDCPQNYNPVCGSDGNTYANSCYAQCAGVSWTSGECPSCICPTNYDPVCGSDGFTYSNACYADCAGVSWTPGPCSDPCICPQDYNPVCGSDGIIYFNSCYAGCAGVSWTPGACPEPCICPQNYDPVCGSDGITYPNSCYADCAGVTWTPGVCPEPCTCPQNYNPVCGSDGITYPNSCYADCAGVSWTSGVCPDPCICPQNYNPVCGSDGITYPNSCYADCAGVSWTPGSCSPIANCPPTTDEVLCLPEIQDDISDFFASNQCFNNGGAYAALSVSRAVYVGEEVILVRYQWATNQFSYGYYNHIYSCEGWLLEDCESFGLSIFCNLGDGSVYDALLNVTEIWDCYDPLPSCNDCGMLVNVINVIDASCGSNNGSINLSVVGGTAPYNYNWTGGPGNIQDPTGLSPGTYFVTVTDSGGCSAVASATVGSSGSTISLSTSVTDAGCGGNDGSINLSVFGGTAPYNYNWTGGPGNIQDPTGLSPGTYFVTVTDSGGCSAVASATVGSSGSTISLSTSVTDAGCAGNDGSINLSVFGGTAPYSYNWAGGPGNVQDPTGLSPGTYFVTVTDSGGCSAVASATVSQGAAAIQLSAEVTNASCAGNDGSIDLTVAGSGTGNTDNNLILSLEDVDAQEGTVICMGLSVENFTDMLSMQFEITYDFTKVQFVSVGNFNLPGLTVNAFGTPNSGTAAGQVTVSWNAPQGTSVTVPDGVQAFELCFLPVSGSSSVVNIEGSTVVVEMLNGAAVVLEDGLVNVSPAGSNSLSFTLEDVSGSIGDEVCVGVSVENFTEIIGMQMSIVYDPSMLEFTTVSGLNIPGLSAAGSFGLPPNTSAGVITMSWIDPVLNGLTLPNSTQIFELCFTLTASGTAPISFSATPTPIEFTSAAFQSISAGLNAGSVTIVDDVAPTYTYNWTGGLGNIEDPSGLAPGAYGVTVSSNSGCSASASYTVETEGGIALDYATSPEFCGNGNGSIIVSASGGAAPFTYEWADSAIGNTPNPSGLTAGIYPLTVTDAAGCTANLAINIDAEGEGVPVSDFATQSDGLEISFIDQAQNGVLNYSWSFGDGATASLPNPVHTYASSGIYEACQIVGNQCGMDTLCRFVLVGEDAAPWEVLSTSSDNHLVVIPEGVGSDIDGEALQAGDFIGFFYQYNGEYYCGGYGQWTGQGNLVVTIYANDAIAPQKNGFDAGEIFKVRVWRISSGEEIDIRAAYLPAGSIFNTLEVEDQNQFRIDGFSVITSLEEGKCLVFNLSEGFNFVSSYLIPDDTEFLSILSPIIDDVVLVKNDLGAIIAPSYGINDIPEWIITEGYRIKIADGVAVSLEVCGQKVDPATTPINLEEGIQWIAYLLENPDVPHDQLSGVSNCIKWVKDELGGAYLPALGPPYGNMSLMQPAFGYKVNALCAAQLNYSQNFAGGGDARGYVGGPGHQSLGLQHFAAQNNTGAEATLIIPKHVVSPVLSVGDELAAFTEDGIQAGAMVYIGHNGYLTLWMDDPATPNIREGLAEGENYVIHIWNASSGEESVYLPLLETGEARFHTDAIDVVAALELLVSPAGERPVETPQWSVYPNPAKNFITLHCSRPFPAECKLKLYASHGQLMRYHNLEELPGQNSNFTLSTAGLPQGLYWLKIESGGKYTVLRFSVLK